MSMTSQFFCVGDNMARLDFFPIFGDNNVLLSLIISVKLFTNISYVIQMSFLGHNPRLNQQNQQPLCGLWPGSIRREWPSCSIIM